MVIFARGYFGLKALQFLIDKHYDITMVVISDKNQEELISLVENYSIAYEIYTETLQDELRNKFQDKNLNWIINIWASHILKKDLLNCFEQSLNVHPSLVPLQKGNDCASWGIREKSKFGITLMTMEEDLDKGDVFFQKELKVKEYTQGKKLQEILIDECINTFIENCQDIFDGKIQPKPQKPGGTYHTREDTKRDRFRKNTERMSLEEMVSWILAHDFSDETTAIMQTNNKSYKLTLNIEEI